MTNSDILPVCLESRHNERLNQDNIPSGGQNRKSRKRKEVPLIVVGVNECMRQLQSDNLRLVVVNKVGKWT